MNNNEGMSHLVLDVGLLRLVQVYLKEPRTVEPDPRAFTDDLGRVDEVVQDSVVDGDERPVTRPLLLVKLRVSALARRLRQDAPLGNHAHVFTRELLLKLAHEATLDLLEGLELRHGHEEDDGLFAADVHLLGGRDVELAQLRLQVGSDLQIEKRLRNQLLELVGFVVVHLDDLRSRDRHLNIQGCTMLYRESQKSHRFGRAESV